MGSRGQSKGVGWGENGPWLCTLDILVETSALKLLERQEGFFCFWVKGQSQMFCHKQKTASWGTTKSSRASLGGKGGQRFTGEGRQVDVASLLLLVGWRYLLANSVRYIGNAIFFKRIVFLKY